MPKKEKTVVTAQDVVNALRAKYPSNAYAFFEQVNNGTGARGSSAFTDALVVSLWPSRGIEAYGFEVKVSRKDWRTELAKPHKAEHVQKYCTRWWVVSGNSCVPVTEVPPKWGLLELRGKGLHIVKEAPALKPKPLDLTFVASIVRNASATIEGLKMDSYLRGLTEGEERGPAEHRKQVGDLNRKIELIEKSLADFETASGVRIGAYDGEYMGKLVKHLLQHRWAFQHGSVDRGPELLDQAAAQLQRLSDAAKNEAEQARQRLALITGAITKDTAHEPS